MGYKVQNGHPDFMLRFVIFMEKEGMLLLF